MMKAEYVHVWIENGVSKTGAPQVIELPFTSASARAMIVRKRDGALLATQHQVGSRFALPGGAFENGESSAETILRELDEENIELIGSDDQWRSRMAVDYYAGYGELSIWHIFHVEEVEIGVSEENIETRWASQDEDIWHPFMHRRILLILEQHFPKLVRVSLVSK